MQETIFAVSLAYLFVWNANRKFGTYVLTGGPLKTRLKNWSKLFIETVKTIKYTLPVYTAPYIYIPGLPLQCTLPFF